jgi:hypothetical protein
MIALGGANATTCRIVFENRGLWRKSLLPHQCSKNLKKISYEPRRNFLLPQFVKNLLPKWSVFVRIFYIIFNLFLSSLVRGTRVPEFIKLVWKKNPSFSN